MKLINSSFEILNFPNLPTEFIEQCGRTCYKSEGKISENSAVKFVRKIMKSGHESVIEHASATVRIICDRGVSHEIVRHRLASYSQESTRYCNYGNSDNGCTFIIPCWIAPETFESINKLNLNKAAFNWWSSMRNAERSYLDLLAFGWSPQQARSVLPNSLKTEIVMTANLREWRHFFNLRTAKSAHPQMREITQPMLETFKTYMPEFFNNA